MSLRRHSTAETAFQRLEIWKSAICCEFRVAGAVHAWWHRDRLLTGLAWDNLAAGVLLRADGPPGSLLMMGLAGGTAMRVLRHLLPECEFTSVDIDREVVALATEHMRLGDLGVEIHFDDAYRWADAADRRYDVVIDDCYLAGAEDVYRPDIAPDEAVGALRRLVSPGGLLLTNLVTGAGHRRLQSRTRAAFKRAFGEVLSITTADSQNETLVGGEALRNGGSLREWEDHFGTKKDRDLWRRLRVRKLK